MQTEEQSLDAVLKLIPKRFFQANSFVATLYIFALLGIAILGAGFSLVVWQNGWTGFYPISWIVLGTAFASFFFVSHACAHYSFFKSRWANVWVGHLAILPAAYPFFSWKFAHDAHHRHTNNRRLDPVTTCDRLTTSYWRLNLGLI